MKLFGKILLLMTAVVGLASCHGQEDDSVQLKLLASSQTITANGEDEVAFEVYYGANPVTAEAQIALVSHPEKEWNGSSFKTTEAGEYIFKATYEGVESEEVKVMANPYVSNFTSRFDRHICIMDFTGAWCSFCPEGYRTLESLVSNPYAGWSDIVTIMALHDGKGGNDPMALPVTNTIHSAFGLPSFPAFVTDLRDSGLLTESFEKIRESLNASLDEYPAQCDVKVTSSLSGDVLTVDVTLFAEIAGEYGVSVWLVEDGVVAPQKDGSADYAEWNHKHVVRALLSNYWNGDKLGTLAREAEGSKSYTYTLPAEWKKEDMTVVALAITPDGYVNNVAVCELNQSVDYKYLTE